jgi:hypothetical protein
MASAFWFLRKLHNQNRPTMPLCVVRQRQEAPPKPDVRTVPRHNKKRNRKSKYNKQRVYKRVKARLGAVPMVRIEQRLSNDRDKRRE